MIRSFTTGTLRANGARHDRTAVSSGDRDRGVGSTFGGQAGVSDELRARVVIWPPLRPTWLRCERGSVSVVLPAGSQDLELKAWR